MTPAASGWSRVETDGVLLRRPVPADAAGVLRTHGDPAVYVHDPAETHRDLADSARWLEPQLEHWAQHGFGFWAVLVPAAVWPDGVPGAEHADGGRVFAGLGGIRNHRIEGEPVLNVYYRFGTPVQGRGLARVVLTQSLAMAPQVAPGVDLVVRTRPANAVARHVAERAGFVDRGLEPGTTDMQLLVHPAPAVTSD